MHRIKGTTPDKDTDWKIKALGKPYGKILDTATGLGYTAIQAARTAAQVTTVEFDPAVVALCRSILVTGIVFQPSDHPGDCRQPQISP